MIPVLLLLSWVNPQKWWACLIALLIFSHNSLWLACCSGASGSAPMAHGRPGWAEDEPGPGPGFGPLLPLSHPPVDQWVDHTHTHTHTVRLVFLFEQLLDVFQITCTCCHHSWSPSCGTAACWRAWVWPLPSRCYPTWWRCSPSTSTASTSTEPGLVVACRGQTFLTPSAGLFLSFNPCSSCSSRSRPCSSCSLAPFPIVAVV